MRQSLRSLYLPSWNRRLISCQHCLPFAHLQGLQLDLDLGVGVVPGLDHLLQVGGCSTSLNGTDPLHDQSIRTVACLFGFIRICAFSRAGGGNFGPIYLTSWYPCIVIPAPMSLLSPSPLQVQKIFSLTKRFSMQYFSIHPSNLYRYPNDLKPYT